MAKKFDPKLEKAAAKLPRFLSMGTSLAASTVGTLMSIFTVVLVPVLAEALTELLKKPGAQKKYGKFLIPARDVLNGADLGDK